MRTCFHPSETACLECIGPPLSESNPYANPYIRPYHWNTIDPYRIAEVYEVTSPQIFHAIKKLLMPGERGGGKDIAQDVREAIKSLERWEAMRAEDSATKGGGR